jgi:hypothetical protein
MWRPSVMNQTVFTIPEAASLDQLKEIAEYFDKAKAVGHLHQFGVACPTCQQYINEICYGEQD